MKINKANKEKLLKRFKDQEDALPIEIELEEAPEIPEEEDFGFLAEVQPESPEDILELLREEGYEAFLRKQELSTCPAERFEEETEEDQAAAKGAWEDGWFHACRDYFSAQTILHASALVELLGAEDNLTEEEEVLVDATLDGLFDSVGQLEQVMDLEELAEYWSPLG